MGKRAAKPPVGLSSTVFPTADDLLVWESLSDAEKRAFLEAELEEARAGGTSSLTIDDLFAKAERIAAAKKVDAL